MRKYLLTIFVVASSIFISKSQTYYIPNDTLFQGCQPDSVHLFLYADSLKSVSYTYDTLPYHTIPIGGTSVAMWDDQVLGPFPVGFNVSWFCGNYSQFYLCSNGWIGFQNTTAAFTPQPIPSTAANVPKNAVMGVWRDWHPGIPGGPYITYQTIGVAPNRKLVVTWNNVPMFSCTSSHGTFQIVVHETSNIIHTNITSVPVCLAWVGGDGVHGVHDPTGTLGFPVTGRNDTPFTASNESLRFIPTSPIIWSYPNGNQIGIGNDLFASVAQSTYVYATSVQCDGDTVVDSVFVASSCINLIVDSVDVDCTGDSTGWIIAQDTSSQLNAPYTYYYINSVTGDTLASHPSNATMDTLINVPAGSYTVVCVSTSEFAIGTTIVNEPDTMPAFTAMIPVLCNGDFTGKAIAVDTNDYAGLNWDGLYSYEWSTGAVTVNSTLNNDTLNGIPIGIYDVTIDGCFIQTGSITVTEPPLLMASIGNQTKTSCPGVNFCDASAEAMPVGGVAPFTYQWSTFETSKIATVLCPGLNYVTITDANGCDTSASVTILVPDSIITSGHGDTLICITNPAAITATSTGGTPPFYYTWTSDSLNGDTMGINQGVTVFPFITTRFFTTSIDANGCPGDTASVLVKVRPELGIELPILDTICPYDNLDIEVNGVGGDSLYTFSWSSGQFGEKITVSPDFPSWFYVTVSDACGSPTYLDSIFVQVGGYSDIKTTLEVTDDSICIGENTTITARSRGGFKGPAEYRYTWNFAQLGGNSIQTVNPTVTTKYMVTVNDLCLSKPGLDTITIYVGDKVLPDYGANPTISCKEADVNLFVKEFNELYTYNWIFGDGNKLLDATNDTVTHDYSTEGCYEVQLEVITDFGCKSAQSAPCMVNILPSPEASFFNHPNNPTNIEPIVQFTSNSTNANHYLWFIDSLAISNLPAFNYEFGDTGFYEVKLTVIAQNGCTDTTIKILHNYLQPILYFPSSFTPNGDGLNDEWKIIGEGINAQGFELEIFDRWGNKIFQSNDPEEAWNAHDKSTGGFMPIGSYVYVVRFIDKYNEAHIQSGKIVISNSGNSKGL